MAFEHKEGQGSLFKNDKQNDRQPDYKGTILINSISYEIAAWKRTSQKGEQYLSLQVSLPHERTVRSSSPLQPTLNTYTSLPSTSSTVSEKENLPF